MIHRRLFCSQWLPILLAILALAASATAQSAVRKPAILFCSPDGVRSTYLDPTYLQELHDKGFEVGYTESLYELATLAPYRLRRYNCLVLTITPESYRVCHQGKALSPERAAAFAGMIDAYVRQGGGVLLIPEERHRKRQRLLELTRLWGAEVLSATIAEDDPEKVGQLTHASYPVPLFYTSNIVESPVSDGVRGVWYPGGATWPLALGDAWRPVIRGSSTSRAESLGAAPVLFAIRERGKGRIALVAEHPQFSMGSGTGFIFNREVLSRGLKDRPSDFGALLEQTYRWLSEPSLASGAMGGYVTWERQLLPPNQRDDVQEYWRKQAQALAERELTTAATLRTEPVFRGLIGAHSAHSDGAGTVEAYRQAAKTAGLDFVVFLERFEELDRAEYDNLVAECRRLSDEDIELIPGFTIRDNLGNHVMCLTKEPFLPPEAALIAPERKILNMQPQDAEGVYEGHHHEPTFSYLLAYAHGNRNTGRYNWADSGHGVRMPSQRPGAMAGVVYYRNGELVEDMLDEYLLTSESTMPPTPVAVNEVYSPEELVREARSGHTLTYAQASSRGAIMRQALRWSSVGDSMNVFPSDGPIIHAWPGNCRPMTYGGEEFVPEVMDAPLRITSEKGLREIVVYDGRRVFRRFDPRGAKTFFVNLPLDGTIMRNLIVVAKDVDGGRAVSFTRRSYKYDSRGLSWCGDHVNDGFMRMFHGPGPLPVCPAPELPWDIAGFTWDGGPPGVLPLVNFTASRPILTTDQGREEGRRFNQVPKVEAGDEGFLATSSTQDTLFDDVVKRPTNAWNTFGPYGKEPELMDYVLTFKEYFPPTLGAPPADLPVRGVRLGFRPCVFRDAITFRRGGVVQELVLLRNAGGAHGGQAVVVIGEHSGAIVRTLSTEELKAKRHHFPLEPGDWFGVFSPDETCSHLFMLRQGDVIVSVGDPGQWGWIRVDADLKGQAVRQGERFVFELASLNSSVEVDLHEAEALRRLWAYMAAPEGLELRRGHQVVSPGLLELKPEDHAVELALPEPREDLEITLPVLVGGLNPNWSAGLFQKTGYRRGFYGDGEDCYRALAVDGEGAGHFPLYPDKAKLTHIAAGHPIAADDRGRELKINVVRLGDAPWRWRVDVNNPTDRAIASTLKQTMALPGLDFAEVELVLDAGELRVLK